jgi:hypothetical protein
LWLLTAIFLGAGVGGMLATIISFFAGHGGSDADHDVGHDVGDHDVGHDVGDHDVGHDVGDHDVAYDHGGVAGVDHETSEALEGKFSLLVISLAVSMYGWAGLGISSLINVLSLPARFIPGVENATGIVAAFSGLGAIPFAILAWYVGAKFYTLLKSQESRPISSLRHAIGYDGTIQTAALRPGSTSRVSISLPGGQIVSGFAVLAEGFDCLIPEGEKVRVIDVVGDTAIVEPERGFLLPKAET